MPDTDKLLGAIDDFESTSYCSDNDETLSRERAFAIDLYLGKNTNPAPDGRSQVVDRAVYEVVNEIKPSLARIFANGDNVVELPPVGPEDEESSKQESDYINYILLQKNNWFEIFDTASMDALLTKSAYLYPYVEKRRQIELERYERQTPESLALIMEDGPEIVGQKEYLDPDYQPQPPQPAIDQMTGQPAMGPGGQPVMAPPPPPPMLYDVEIRRTKVDTAFCVEVLPPERCKIAKSTKAIQVSRTCPYFEYYDFPTISELRQDGYDVDDDIGRGDGTDDTLEDTARNQFGELDGEENHPNDPSMRKVKCRYVWVRYDYDEDGIAELQFCVIAGKQLLHREEVNRIPIGVLCPDPLPHRHPGLCPADTTADLQQIGTVMLRQGIDNLQLSNNPQKFGDPSKVNLDDALVSRPGNFLRTRNGAIFGQDFGVMQVPDIFPSVMNGLQYLDHIRQKRTGVSSNFQGLDANQLSQLQPGTVNQISSMAAQRVEHIARHFANGITETCSILHELILKSGHKKDVVKLRNTWVTVDPTTWKHKRDFKIAVGFAAGNKDAQIARLMGMGAMQKEALMGGLPIVTAQNAYETAVELTKANGFSSPERFWTDPQKIPPPQPPQPDATVMAAEQMKSQTTLQVKDAELRTEKEVKSAELQSEQQLAILEAQTKLQIAQLSAQTALQTNEKSAETSLRVKSMDAAKSPDELTGARVRAQENEQKAASMEKQLQAAQQNLAETQSQVGQALEFLSKSKRVIRRDKRGKAEGVDIFAPDGSLIAQQKVVRGPDNRIVGAE
jgi:hypothetical protein